MTYQYIAGELSLRVADLQDVTPDEVFAHLLRHLRHEAECCPRVQLDRVVCQTLDVADAVCFASLDSGDVNAFAKQSAVAADLLEFAVCACLLSERAE